MPKNRNNHLLQTAEHREKMRKKKEKKVNMYMDIEYPLRYNDDHNDEHIIRIVFRYKRIVNSPFSTDIIKRIWNNQMNGIRNFLQQSDFVGELILEIIVRELQLNKYNRWSELLFVSKRISQQMKTNAILNNYLPSPKKCICNVDYWFISGCKCEFDRRYCNVCNSYHGNIEACLKLQNMPVGIIPIDLLHHDSQRILDHFNEKKIKKKYIGFQPEWKFVKVKRMLGDHGRHDHISGLNFNHVIEIRLLIPFTTSVDHFLERIVMDKFPLPSINTDGIPYVLPYWYRN